MTPDQKLDAIFNKVSSLETKLEVSIAYQKVQENRINKHEQKVEVLEANRNIDIGKKTVWSLIAGTVGAGIVALIKHF